MATTPRGSELARISPADSMATSVPAPIAMPTSARASAGASLTPSPTIATVEPASLELGDLGVLVLGQDLGEHLVDAEVGPDRIGDLAGVAGDHHDAPTHAPAVLATAARASGRTSSSSARPPTIASPRTR